MAASVARRAATRAGIVLLATLTPAGCTPAPEATERAEAVAPRGERIVAAPLGRIADAVAGEDGRLYVLDADQLRLAVIPTGQLAGGEGHGPGEYVDPVALADAGESGLYLLDRGAQRLDRFVERDGRLDRSGSVQLDFIPEDLCILNARLFMLGARDGRLIHEIDPATGRVLRSLVADPAAGEPMPSAHPGSGFLACGPGETLTVLPLLHPEIARYSVATGERIGRVRVPRFRATRVSVERNAVVYRAPAEGVTDYAASLTPLPDGRLLVQAGPVPRGARRHEFASLRSLVLSWDDASLREVNPSLPRIVDVRGDTALAVHSDPEPALGRIPLRAILP